MPRHEVRRRGVVARAQRMVERFLDQIARGEPCGCPAMQLGDRHRIHPLAQSLAQKSPEQVVEAKELIVAIERNQEEVEALDLGEKRTSPRIRLIPVGIVAADGLAERGAEPVEDRQLEEAILHLR